MQPQERKESLQDGQRTLQDRGTLISHADAFRKRQLGGTHALQFAKPRLT